MRVMIRFGLIVAALAASPAAAQQDVDAHYKPKVEHPAYQAGGPMVAVDEAHRNFHTLSGRYAPFGKLLAADGYRVQASASPFSADALKGVDVLVIANAEAPAPGRPAFGADEVQALKQWVEGGGSLLLIADHAPFGSAASALASAFGVDMGTGYAVARQWGKVTSNIEFTGTALGDHPILHGRDKSEQVRHVKSFTGQSLGTPAGGAALLILPADALEVPNERAVDDLRRGEAVPGRRVGGRAQALAFSLGKGRVVVAGEAAMFSAQVIRFPNGTRERMGLSADDDETFALNIMHWLSRLIG
jgi:hypothetical protein